MPEADLHRDQPDEQRPSALAARHAKSAVAALAEVEDRLLIAIDAPLTTLASIPSSSRPRDSRPVPGVSHPMTDLHLRADERVRAAIADLSDLAPTAGPPPRQVPGPDGPRPATAGAIARWVVTAAGEARNVVDLVLNAWWRAPDDSHDRFARLADLETLARAARQLRNSLDWTLASDAAPANHRCDDPLDRGCDRIVRDADGYRRGACGACRQAVSRSNRTA